SDHPPSAGPPLSASSGQPSAQPSPGRPDASAARHRVAAGLPAQPSPVGAAKSAARPDQPVAGLAKGILGLDARASGPAKNGANQPPTGTATGGPIASNPAVADATREGATPDVPMPARPMSGKVAPAAPSLAMPPFGTAQPASPGRVMLGVGEPEPPISARPDGLGGSLMEPKRITPLSPRAAPAPDHVPAASPPRRRASNPLVIVGNAVFTALVLVLLIGGAAVVFGKSRFEAPGPLQEDKIVNIPPRTGMIDIADLLNREGVVDANRFVFIGGVFALKARSELKAGEYLFPK